MQNSKWEDTEELEESLFGVKCHRVPGVSLFSGMTQSLPLAVS